MKFKNKLELMLKDFLKELDTIKTHGKAKELKNKFIRRLIDES